LAIQLAALALHLARSRGEVGIQAELEFRVRGLSTIPSLTVFAEAAPHPNPLPAKGGAREYER
jgi:hypothetical protein